MFPIQLPRLSQYLWTLCVHLVIATFLLTVADSFNEQDYLVGRKQVTHNPSELSDAQFLEYSNLSDKQHMREAIRNILVPRVVGTGNHTIVRQYIVQSLRDLGWHVELNSFHDTAPIVGALHFHNIIATLNPQAERFLVLACHYDSKYMENVAFLGATDSAVPCAMLLNLAKVLQEQLEPFKNTNVSLMLLFFDGEEAFEQWGPKDSIYGARHLAKLWQDQGKLDRIDLLVLLDLLGAPDPAFYSFFANTELWHMRLMALETRLSQRGLLQRYMSSGVSQHDPTRYFQPQATRSAYIEDDHIPFLQRNVPILHLIPMPFPSVWHTPDDNESVIDYATTENLALIVRLFTLEYLHGGVAQTK
ncbi:glutaminyl-peptide cyclotransferase isoform X1 [Scaptodrosophila lebanonensis]|uniref:Glutaminyl-peptide cyclotransferase n=1 Tax=Drosophila lebanonensis TaxID=7225 RepID=A0A6J2U4X5_DROLE|nr:glutaminyl-peptide cyclotransferase isoform X1 [Scaptodrosophila lebanonensis]